MKLRYFIAFLVTGAVLGCKATSEKQDIWVHFGDGPVPCYANFYVEFPKYPEYAISEYTINEQYDERNDLKHLRESLRLCRATFATAYKAKKLQRTNPEDGYDRVTFESKPGWRNLLPFEPRYVLFAIENRADLSCKVAYVIPAETVFSERYKFEIAVRVAYVDRDPYHPYVPTADEQVKGWSPNERERGGLPSNDIKPFTNAR